jgi:uncharacterized protein (DUF1499 family)
MTEISINREFNEVYDFTIEMLKENGFFIKEHSKDAQYIKANRKSTLFSFGERVEVIFKSPTKHKTQIIINSYLRAQAFDLGNNNKKNEVLIASKIKSKFP